MKNVLLPIIGALFILAIAIGGSACGGGGGSSSSTTTTTGTNSGTTGLTNIRVEATLAGFPDSPIDPLNIQAGETIQFQVVGYDSSRQRHILSSGNWTTNDNGHVVGTLQSDGTFSATNSSATVFTVTGLSQGKSYSTGYRVKPIQALVTGLILDSNGFGASHVSIVFYTAGGTEVSRAVSQFDGSFRASVPTSAKMFNLDPTTMPKNFYFRSFVYQGKRYTALDKSCSASLPALTNGTTTPIGTLTIDAAETNGNPNPPPPPPDGCPV